MKIEWVNHASFIVEHDGVRMISDPWLEGLAFDHGWAHLVPTAMRYDDFATITHIWISHEHPDHFAPRNLLAIPEEHRRRITLMFHEGVDFRIGAFCRNAGFGKVLQLRSGRWEQLAGDLRVKCADQGGDTWMAVRSRDTTLLNLNDAIFAYRWRIQALRRKVGAPIDVLLSQFSYANWVGNPDEPMRHRAEATEMLRRLRTQMEVLRPRYAIPFASMVRFCHAENAYLNEAMNRVETASEAIAATGTTPVVLYPGETWEVGAPHDSEASIARYRPHYEAVAEQELVESPSVPIEELQRLAQRFWRIIRRRNPSWTLWLAAKAGRLEPTRDLALGSRSRGGAVAGRHAHGGGNRRGGERHRHGIGFARLPAPLPVGRLHGPGQRPIPGAPGREPCPMAAAREPRHPQQSGLDTHALRVGSRRPPARQTRASLGPSIAVGACGAIARLAVCVAAHRVRLDGRRIIAA